jgi:hypothetical protein
MGRRELILDHSTLLESPQVSKCSNTSLDTDDWERSMIDSFNRSKESRSPFLIDEFESSVWNINCTHLIVVLVHHHK